MLGQVVLAWLLEHRVQPRSVLSFHGRYIGIVSVLFSHMSETCEFVVSGQLKGKWIFHENRKAWG